MINDEIEELHIKAQNNNAKYIMFCFDIHNSRKLNDLQRYNAQMCSIKTMNLLLNKIKNLEKAIQQDILVRDNLFVLDDITKLKNHMLVYKNNPCIIFGDSFVFSIYSNSIKYETFMNLAKEAKIESKNQFSYHVNSANYETTDIRESNKKYYVGDIISKLSLKKEKTLEF